MTTPPRFELGHLVCIDSNRTPTIIVVATRHAPATRAKDNGRTCRPQRARAIPSKLWAQLTLKKRPTLAGAGSGWVYIKTIVGVLHGAPETDVRSTYLTIDPSRDPTTPDVVSIDVDVFSDFGSGYIQLGADGSV